jgi:hypothetical protein
MSDTEVKTSLQWQSVAYATLSETNEHSSDGIQDEFFMTGRSDDDSNNNNEVSKRCSTKQPTKSVPSKKPPNDDPSDSQDSIAFYTNEHPERTCHKTYRNDPSKCNQDKKEPFESTHKNDFFMNQRFSSSEFGTESTHDKTPKENSDNALFSQQDTDEQTNEFSNEDPSQGCHNTNAPSKGQIPIALSQNQLFASSDEKASTSQSDHIDDIYHAKEYPAKEYPNTTPAKINYKNQDSSNSNHTNDISTSNDLNVLPKIQVSISTYAIAYPSTNANFSTNAICSSSAPVPTTYVQQFCFLPFNPHFPFPVLSDMPDFSSVFPQNIPLSHLYWFNLFPDHPS